MDRPSVHLLGLCKIAGHFGVGKATVRQWKRNGAPILLVGKKMQAYYSELWSWLRTHEAA